MNELIKRVDCVKGDREKYEKGKRGKNFLFCWQNYRKMKETGKKR